MWPVTYQPAFFEDKKLPFAFTVQWQSRQPLSQKMPVKFDGRATLNTARFSFATAPATQLAGVKAVPNLRRQRPVASQKFFQI
jgi:hypothetical protein